MSRSCMLWASLVLIAATASAFAEAPPVKVPKELLQKRVEAVRKVWDQNKTRIQNREGLPSELFGWSERWLEAELVLCEKEGERIKALKDHLERTREVERIAAALAKTGQGRQSDADAATFFRLDAEIRLIKEGGMPQPAKEPKEKQEKPTPRLSPLPALPPNTLPSVVLPFDPTGSRTISILSVTSTKQNGAFPRIDVRKLLSEPSPLR